MDSLAEDVSALSADAADALPAATAWQHRSTLEVPGQDRFDFCRELAMGSHVERPLGTRDDFFADFRYTVTADGIGFAELDVDPCVSRFGPGGQDALVDIGMLNAGSMHIRHGRDQTLVLNAGAGPVLFDPTRPLTTCTSRSDLTVLRLPRSAVVAAIGGDAVPRFSAVRPLAPGVLTSELAACLHNLRYEAERDTPVSGATLETAGALALVALAQARGERHHWPGELNAALYRAACHQLTLRAADPLVTVPAVAQVLGCSRAELYRLFATRGETVAGHLYEVRMQRASTLLRKRPQLAIGAIALRCSYAEPAAFDKAFRRRFGMTPRDWRAACAGAHHLTV